jgi:hypothetical protein
MLKESIERLNRILDEISKEKIDLGKKSDQRNNLTDFRAGKESYSLRAFNKALAEVKKEFSEISGLKATAEARIELMELLNKLDDKDIMELQKTARRILEITKLLPENKIITRIEFELPKNIPAEIATDISADIKELEKCYANNCFRSSIILCGRLLETALHRKYFDVTGFDILEKNPGIGLGNLIAKLAEKNVQLDPGLTQQIHLINQVRVFSVHKKKEGFCPSKDQTLAIILYTMDSLRKLLK